MTQSSWRAATGVCMLVAGLMAASGSAVASANPGSDSNSNTSSGASAGGSSSGQGADQGVDKGSDDPAEPAGPGHAGAVRAALREVTTAFRVGQWPGAASPGGSTGSAAANGPLPATARIARAVTAMLVPPEPSTASPQPTPDPGSSQVAPARTGSEYTAPVAEPSALDVPPTPNATALADDPAPAPSVPAPIADPVAAPVAAGPVAAGQVATMPDVTASIAGMLAAIHGVLASTTAAIQPFIQLPADFASLMMAAAAAQPAVGAGPLGASPNSGGTIPTPWQRLQSAAAVAGLTASDGVQSTPMAGEPSPATVAAPTALAAAASTAMGARTAADVGVPQGLQDFWRGYGGLILATSLSALVLAALPGLLGFGVSTAAGVRLGVRQAKAGQALQASGIARFAGGGPIGIVRSGSLVAIRPRASRPVRAAAPPERHLRSVA